jgi:hypothetical protein
MNRLLILFLFLLPGSCQANDSSNSPYAIALSEGMTSKDIYYAIMWKDKQSEYDSKIVEINGYIDSEYSRLYSDSSLNQNYYPVSDNADNEISFGLDINIRDLNNYTCPDSMVRIEATYKYEETEHIKRHHLVDIVKIYAYDTTPFHKGGTGGLIECYSAE